MLAPLPVDFATACRQAAAAGFAHVDVAAAVARPPQNLEVLAETGLTVSGAVIGLSLPGRCTLDADSLDARRSALALLKQEVADAAQLGATRCCLRSAAGTAGLAAFAEACSLLADFAGRRMVALCIEHVPASALPTAAATIDWIAQTGHPDLRLLLNLSHCAVAGEDPAGMIRRAGSRLGGIHVAAVDGLTEAIRVALRDTGYDGALTLAWRAEGMRQVREEIERLLRTGA
jgi:sugar phosphate isomerase/epimerase